MRSMGCFMALKFGIWMLAFNGLSKYSACKIVQGLSPYLPFMISRESSKVNFQSSFLHFFHCVFSVFDAHICFAAGDVEELKLAVKKGGIGEQTGDLLFCIEGIGSRMRNSSKNSGAENAYRPKAVEVFESGVKRLATTHGQAADGAVCGISKCSIGAVDKRNNVLGHFLFKPAHGSTAVTPTTAGYIPVGHDYYHGAGFSPGN